MGKKIGILFGITAVLVFGIVFAGNYSKSQAVHVETIILQQVSEENTVTCTGKVENSKQKKVYVNQGAVAQEIYVEEGQRIEKGDVLMSVKVPVEQEAQEDSASSGSASSDAIDVDALSNLYGLNANQSQQFLSSKWERGKRIFTVPEYLPRRTGTSDRTGFRRYFCCKHQGPGGDRKSAGSGYL